MSQTTTQQQGNQQKTGSRQGSRKSNQTAQSLTNSTDTTTSNGSSKGENWQQTTKSSNGFKNNNNNRRRSNNSNGKQRAQTPKDIKTIYINKVFMRDLEALPNLAPQLKKQRVQILREILSSVGEIESFEDQVEQNSTVLVTFQDHDTAIKALETLRNKEEAEFLMKTAKDKLKEIKLPETVCPPLFKYKFGLATQQKKGPKTAFAQQKSAQAPSFKTVVASSLPQQQAVPQPQPPQSQPQPEKKKEKKAAKQTQPAKEEEIKVEYLTRKTEIARLNEENAFFSRQANHVRSELEAERLRVTDRISRITSLTQDLDRVQQEKQRLENQLENEAKWRKKGEESIQKLEDELKHLLQQQSEVEHRLQQFSKTSQNGALL